MANVVLDFQLTDDLWFDSNYLMTSFYQLRNELNGSLDNANFVSIMSPLSTDTILSENVQTNNILSTGNININYHSDFQVSSGSTLYLRIRNGEVSIG